MFSPLSLWLTNCKFKIFFLNYGDMALIWKKKLVRLSMWYFSCMLLFHEPSKITQHVWFWQEGWTVGPLSPPFNWLHHNVRRVESLETIQNQGTENPLLPWWLFSEQILQDTLILSQISEIPQAIPSQLFLLFLSFSWVA